MTKEEARQKIAELVKKFDGLTPKEIKATNEANTKQSFIIPMFRALGWDMDDTHEVALEESASSGRVDFAFKINDVAMFYLEAKKLNADINNPIHKKQAITYAYNKGVIWAVLTNFDELRVFNAQKDAAWITLKYSDFLANFDRLWLLSRESFEAGITNKQATLEGALPPLIPIEERLFKQLRAWRGNLFNQLYHFNKQVKPEQRDEVIEKLFNRLIFIRTAEDRHLEDLKLRAAVHQWENNTHKTGGELAAALNEIFVYYNGYYDSELFGKHLLDSPELNLDDYILAEILKGLYEIPGGMADYDFSIIDADVLGRVYEQYLGYVAKVEQEKAKEKQAQLGLGLAVEQDYQMVEKKVHRKEQGIYYTPKFVTDYIVKETVGRFIKEHEAQGYNKILNMRILDPACGSGSFLIRAYDELLNYHAKVRSKAANELEQQDRMPILTGNIFGVDLDRQAVEIARLNLLLRGLAKRDHLPPLTDNIKQGNSLISGTEKNLKEYFGKEWKSKQPFNWEEEFKDIMTSGGFDVIIGNPPYGINFDKASKLYLEETYPPFKRNNDIYVAFIQKGLQLLKNGGYFSLILPNTFLGGSYFDHIKDVIEQAKILKRIDFGIHQVFPEPNVFNAILVLQKEKIAESRSANVVEFIDALESDITNTNNIKIETVAQSKLSDLWWKSITPLVTKMLLIAPKLDTIAFVKDVGLNYWSKGRGKTRGDSIGDKVLYNGKKQDDRDLPFLKGRDIERYQYKFSENWLMNNYSELLVPEIETFRYSPEFLLNGSKIIYRQTSDCIIATIDNANYLVDKTLHVIMIRENYLNDFNLKYVLGILNSRLATYIYRDLAKEQGRLFAQVKTFIMKRIPIRQIDFAILDEKVAHDRLVALVEKMLELNKKLTPMRDQYSHERDELVKEIEKTDREIDNLVYGLYNLTDKERQIVENGSK
jgi:adenine-specific DNA-methyltransferase